MRGLKENVIIGKLIPAGTGSPEYQMLQPALPGAATVTSLSILGGDMPPSADEGLPENPAEWLASLGAQRGSPAPRESRDSSDGSEEE
jgi:hypothetical protein